MREPFWVVLTCVESLQERGNPRREALLNTFTEKLKARAFALEDSETYLAIPHHRALIALLDAPLSLG